MTSLRLTDHTSWKRLTRSLRAMMVASLPALLGLAVLTAATMAEAATTRIKDIVDVEGVRDNQLIGYGLVVGLNGTGDSINNSPFTEQSLIGMLERLGVNVRNDQLRTDNVAAVMVTANLPPFATHGTSLDVNVSALGDADSLLGGTLLVTPLLGADGEVVAVAQGPVAVAGFDAQGAAASVTRGVPTSGRVPGGAIVEREVDFDLNSLSQVRLSLRNPDFTTSARIANAINQHLGRALANSANPATVTLQIPETRRNDVAGLITDIENLPIRPDQPARVVVDERSGVIVMGENVRISTVAIAQGNLTIRITETPQVSQPQPFGEGETVIVPRTDIQIDEDEDRQLAVLPAGVSLQELVDSLNALGVGPRDIITILQSIKRSGALQAELEVM